MLLLFVGVVVFGVYLSDVSRKARVGAREGCLARLVQNAALALSPQQFSVF